MKLNKTCMKAVLEFTETQLNFLKPDEIGSIDSGMNSVSLKMIVEHFENIYDIQTIKYTIMMLREGGYIKVNFSSFLANLIN